MIVKKLEVGPLGTNCYIVGCPETLKGVVIDPGGNAKLLIKTIKELKLKIKYIINTHGHWDHIGANGELKEATGALLVIHEEDASCLTDPKNSLVGYFTKGQGGVKADELLQEGDVIKFGKESELRVIHTPGHSLGGICLDEGEHLFTGDTLFAGSIGRTDLPGGSYQELMDSVRNKIFTLPGDRKIWPGHGPGSTLSNEKATNPFFID